MKRSEPWNRLLTLCKGAFTEADLALLYWDTVRDICQHFGITTPVDLAHIELRWKRMQGGVSQRPRGPPMAVHVDVNQSLDDSSILPSPPSGMTALGDSSLRGDPTRDSPKQPTRGPVMAPSSQEQKRSASAVGQPQQKRTTSPAAKKAAPVNSNATLKPVVVPRDLLGLFEGFSSFGRGFPDEMDHTRCVKFCRDCNLVCTNLQSQDVEILFAKFRRKEDRKLRYPEFRMKLIPAIAERLNVSVSDVVRLCLTSKGPRLLATRPDDVPLHDDKRTYTGLRTYESSASDSRNGLDRKGGQPIGRGVRAASPRT